MSVPLIDMLKGRAEELDLEAQICRIRSRRQEGDQREHLEVAAESLDAAARDLRAGVAALGGGTFLHTIELWR